MNDGNAKPRKMCEFLPRYCFGSTAIFIIVFCLLCSLSALGPKLLESMMLQDQLVTEKEYANIDTSTCQIQPLQAPDREVQANFLTSYPGSGARLLSRLVEALSGIPTTDDVYSNGVTNTVGINTYYPCPEGQETPGADSIPRAAILIRHPLDSIPAYHNLLHQQQMSNRPGAPKEDWAVWSQSKLLMQIDVWTKHLEYWLDRYPAKNRLVVSYDQLLSSKRGPSVAKDLAEFLSLSNGVVTVPRKEIPCLWQRLVDEYELTLPPSERRPRVKRVLPRKEDRSGSVRANKKNQKQENENNENGANVEGHSDRRFSGNEQKRSKRGAIQVEDGQEDRFTDNSKGHNFNRLGGKKRSYSTNEEDQQRGHQEQEVTEEEGNQDGVGQAEEGDEKSEGIADEENEDKQEEEQSEQLTNEGRGANQLVRNSRSRANTDQQEGSNEDRSNEESAESEEGGNVVENEEAESDQKEAGENERLTERRGAVRQERGQPNVDEQEGGEGEQTSEEDADNGQQRWRRRLSQESSSQQRRKLMEAKKEFPIDGRKELLIQLSRLLEKYHRDETLSGILVEYIDELEKRYPS